MQWLISLLTGGVLPAFLLLSGGYFLVSLKAFPLRHPRRSARALLSGGSPGEVLRSFTLALGGTLGVGNIVGVAAALLMGGAGAVFWIWAGASFSMLLKYAEITLAAERSERRRKEGATAAERETEAPGAAGYIKDALGRAPALLFTILSLLLSLTMGAFLQGSVIAETVEGSGIGGGHTGLLVGVILSCFAGLLFLGGEGKLATISLYLVPIFTILYTSLAVFIIIARFSLLPSLIVTIFEEAFSLQSFGSGVLGLGLARAMKSGVGKGLFSNEAGAGTSPMAYEGAATRPVSKGIFGILEVVIDTHLMCTLTAFAILLVFPELPDLSPAALTGEAFLVVFGPLGADFVSLATVFFSLLTVNTWIYYGRSLSSYFGRRLPFFPLLYPVLFSLCLLLGAVSHVELAFLLTDLSLALMTVINLTALLHERRRIKRLTEEEGLL